MVYRGRFAMRKKKPDTGNEEILAQWNIEYTWVDKLLHPFILVASCLADRWNDLRYRCQRFKKGYSDRDVWEMRDWFIQTAKPMLRELSAKAYNYPEEAGEEQWREILLEMADLLEIMDVWDDTAARKQAGVEADDKSQTGAQLIGAEKEKAKNRFFFLFNKWFYDLWY